MTIPMTHPDLPGQTIQAVNDRQADHLATRGWERAAPTVDDTAELIADTAEGLETSTTEDPTPLPDHPAAGTRPPDPDTTTPED